VTVPDAGVYRRLLIEALAELLWLREQRASTRPPPSWETIGGSEQRRYRDRAAQRVRILAREDV
jgi:hypothetical protein